MTILSIIGTIALGCYIYDIVSAKINIRKENEIHKRRMFLSEDISRKVDRSNELISHIQDLIDDEDFETADLLNEDLQSNIKKIERLEKELNNICI